MSRSSRGLGRCPLTAVTGVRIPYGTPNKSMGYVLNRPASPAYGEHDGENSLRCDGRQIAVPVPCTAGPSSVARTRIARRNPLLRAAMCSRGCYPVPTSWCGCSMPLAEAPCRPLRDARFRHRLRLAVCGHCAENGRLVVVTAVRLRCSRSGRTPASVTIAGDMGARRWLACIRAAQAGAADGVHPNRVGLRAGALCRVVGPWVAPGAVRLPAPSLAVYP